MLHAAKDSVAVAKSSRAAMDAYGKEAVQEYIEIPAVQILNARGSYAATMGVFPPWTRPFLQYLPWFGQGRQAHEDIVGMAVVMVAKRLSTTTDRNDLLGKLQQGKDNEGKPMSKEALTAEALGQLVAGSDTTAKYVCIKNHLISGLINLLLSSSCAIAYYLAQYPRVQAKLQKELDDHLGTEDETVSNSEQVKRVPYLEAVINEALRHHSTSAMGLPRIVPEGGLTVLGRQFLEGTVVSVPSYSIHRDQKIWGEDACEFRPERWLEQDQVTLQKAFNPFSFGPRYQ
jgi:benzoate 4-monooxygenase